MKELINRNHRLLTSLGNSVTATVEAVDTACTNSGSGLVIVERVKKKRTNQKRSAAVAKTVKLSLILNVVRRIACNMFALL